MKKCTKCGAEFEGNFCPACGAQYEEPAKKYCPKCGKQAEANQRFCDACGFSFDSVQPAQPAYAQPAAQPAQPVYTQPAAQPAQPAYTQPAAQPVQPAYTQPAPAPAAPVAEDAHTYPSKFTGGVFSLFVYEAAVFLGTLLTFGFCYPFLMCWKMRWETENTVINGRKLVFDGKAGDLFKHYVIWLLLSFVTCGIYFIIKGQINIVSWQTKHTHFEGIEVAYEDEGDAPLKTEGGNAVVYESKFDGKWYELLGVKALTFVITIITFSFGYYWAHCYMEKWWCKHKLIDNHTLYFDGKAGQYFGQRIKWTLLTIITFGIYGFWLNLKSVQWTAKHTHVEDPASLPAPTVGVKANKAGQPPYNQAAYAQPAPANSGSNGLAIAGFVLVFFGVQPVGLILSIVGLVKAKDYGGKGKGLAIAGIVLGALSIVFFGIIYIVAIGMTISTGGMYSALAALPLL
ncbi:MAG: DUF898 family protein [Clostridia bacterium]|nr:DUF898 family protein [Clostridia bacterium]